MDAFVFYQLYIIKKIWGKHKIVSRMITAYNTEGRIGFYRDDKSQACFVQAPINENILSFFAFF